MAMKTIVLYEANLNRRHRNGSRVERVLRTNKKHPWSGRTLYALYRSGRTPIVLFVPSANQLDKIRKRSGIIRITAKQTASGIGSGWAV